MTFDQTREQFLEKPLPSAPEAERVIIGAIFLDDGLIDKAKILLKPKHMYSPLHRRVYEAQIAVSEIKPPVKIDPISVGEELKKNGSLESLGGIATITNLTYGLPQFSDLSHYIKLIKDKFALRELISMCNQITSECLAEEEDAGKVLKRAENMITETVNDNNTNDGSHVVNASKAVDSFNLKIRDWKTGKNTAIPSFSPVMNRYLREGGLILGDLSVVMARPSDGKTTWGVQNAWYVAKHHCKSMVITLEQSHDEIIEKIIAGEAYVPNYKIRKELFHSEDQHDLEYIDRIAKIQPYIRSMKERFFIDDKSQTLSEVLETIYRFAVDENVLYFCVDYGGKVKNDLMLNPKQTNREREAAQIIEELKNMAKRKTRTKPKVHINLLWQLGRTADGGKAPSLADGRETGAIEQEADVILAPYGVVPTKEVVMRDMTMLNLKQRKGRRGWSVPMALHGDLQRFYDDVMREDDRVNLRALQEVFGDETEF